MKNTCIVCANDTHVNIVTLYNFMHEVCENGVTEFSDKLTYCELVELCTDNILEVFHYDFIEELMENNLLNEEGIEYFNIFCVNGVTATFAREIFKYVSDTVRNMIK